MKLINVEIRWCDKNYSCAWGDKDVGAVLSTGRTLEELKKDFEQALAFHVEGMVEDGEAPEWAVDNSYKIVYTLHISAVLRQAEQYTTMATVSRMSGINASLLRHYASSIKEPRKNQRDKIIDALHTIGNEMLAL